MIVIAIDQNTRDGRQSRSARPPPATTGDDQDRRKDDSKSHSHTHFIDKVPKISRGTTVPGNNELRHSRNASTQACKRGERNGKSALEIALNKSINLDHCRSINQSSRNHFVGVREDNFPHPKGRFVELSSGL